MDCFVVGLSSPSGGGKTTLVRRLAAIASNAVIISFDEYDDFGEGANVHPPDLQEWLAAGADYNAWQMPRLLHDIKQLKQGKSIFSPIDGAPIWPQPLLLLDIAFGRAHAELSAYLDFMVYIDTPLDVALARRLQRDYFTRNDVDPQMALQEIHAMTATYLSWARAAYLEMDRQVKPQCDLVVDGCLPVDVLTGQILGAVKERFPDKQ